MLMPQCVLVSYVTYQGDTWLYGVLRLKNGVLWYIQDFSSLKKYEFGKVELT